jgi:hypothetical protein
MRTRLIAIAAAALLMPMRGHAKELSDAAWHKKFDNCEMTDRRGPNHDGDEFCMSKTQIAAFNREIMARAAASAARDKEDSKVNLKNCGREIGNAKTLGSWYPGALPTEEECRPYIAQIEAITDARINHAVNKEIATQCTRMADVPGASWKAISALRGIAVSLDDCVKAATALSIEDDAQ